MAHYVICVKCGKRFDRDKVPCHPSLSKKNRFEHDECPSEETKDEVTKDGDITDNEVIASTDFVLSSPPKVDTSKKEFADKLTSFFGRNTARAWQQAEKYRRELGYTYKGMAQALEYFYEIKENSIEKSCGGIGIVPYIYQEAIDFYKQIEEDRQRAVASLKNYSTQVETIAIPSPSNKKRLNDEFFMEEEDNGQ